VAKRACFRFDVDALGLGYRLFLRTQGEDGMDVICYAVPRGWV
jgi:hypothetical protein